MSDTDSFIEEVSEEVRRDRLYKVFKKYGWIAVVVVVSLVGGAAFNEYSKISDQKHAAELGDDLYRVMQLGIVDRLPEFDNIDPKRSNGKALVQLIKANTLVDVGNVSEAIGILESVASNSNYSILYREIADFKSILLSNSDLSKTLLKLETYSQPGSAFRIIALEEISLILIQLNQIDEAISTLTNLLQEPNLNQGQAKRSSDLLRTLKGSTSAEGQG